MRAVHPGVHRQLEELERPGVAGVHSVTEAGHPGAGLLHLVEDRLGHYVQRRGRVLAPDCATPLVDATVEVWQADDTGRYDVNYPDPPDDPSEYKLRAQIQTDAEGRYEYETILPGRSTADMHAAFGWD